MTRRSLGWVCGSEGCPENQVRLGEGGPSHGATRATGDPSRVHQNGFLRSKMRPNPDDCEQAAI
jgi:hypothetical protein